ncbi:MAG: serine hydrolase, partial [Patescibacteria group bacterium]|nr:serine hydrolase [Patescibacteria group bacterium]
NRKIHPDRAIDLDVVAFEKIASKGAGIIKVKIEPLATAKASVIVTTPSDSKPEVEKPEVIAKQPEVNATSAIAIWEKGNKVAYQKEIDKKLPIASLTKIVAMKVFLETGTSMNKIVTYKKADENFNYEYCKPWESARLTVKEGETMTVKDLMYSALVGSANNAIESLVRASGLSRQDFIAKMNSTVKKWGTKNTKFVEPTGLSPDNMSSVSDYAIITEEAFKDETLQKIATTKTYSFSTINTKKKHNLKNTSKIIQANTYNITASKTGYLHEAGYCLMSRVKVGSDNLIVIVLGSPSSAASVESTKKIIEFATAK